MSKSTGPKNSRAGDGLTAFVGVPVTPADAELLDVVAARNPLARRGAVVRQALRRGLASLEAEAGGKSSRRPS
jgi:hypothetical protein